jgi:hypothetical protein
MKKIQTVYVVENGANYVATPVAEDARNRFNDWSKNRLATATNVSLRKFVPVGSKRASRSEPSYPNPPRPMKRLTGGVVYAALLKTAMSPFPGRYSALRRVVPWADYDDLDQSNRMKVIELAAELTKAVGSVDDSEADGEVCKLYKGKTAWYWASERDIIAKTAEELQRQLHLTEGRIREAMQPLKRLTGEKLFQATTALKGDRASRLWIAESSATKDRYRDAAAKLRAELLEGAGAEEEDKTKRIAELEDREKTLKGWLKDICRLLGTDLNTEPMGVTMKLKEALDSLAELRARILPVADADLRDYRERIARLFAWPMANDDVKTWLAGGPTNAGFLSDGDRFVEMLVAAYQSGQHNVKEKEAALWPTVPPAKGFEPGVFSVSFRGVALNAGDELAFSIRPKVHIEQDADAGPSEQREQEIAKNSRWRSRYTGELVEVFEVDGNEVKVGEPDNAYGQRSWSKQDFKALFLSFQECDVAMWNYLESLWDQHKLQESSPTKKRSKPKKPRKSRIANNENKPSRRRR